MLPRSVALASISDSKLEPVVKIVSKKSSTFPIASFINFSVSLRCSPVKFCKLPSFNFLKKSKLVFTLQSPFFVFFLFIFLTMT